MSFNIENAQKNLQNFIFQSIGINVNVNVTEEENRFDFSKKVIHVETDDFVELMIPPMFKGLKIIDFGFNIRETENETLYVINLSYRYQLFTMGTNGSSFALVVLNSNGDIIEHRLAQDD